MFTRLLKIFFIALLLVVVGEAGYYFYYLKNNSKTEIMTSNDVFTTGVIPKPTVLLSNYTPQEDLELNVKDVNAYFKEINHPSLVINNIPSVEAPYLLGLLNSIKKNYLVLDVREEYERLFYSFKKNSNILEIRLGDIINNKAMLDPILLRKKEIIVVSSTESRASVAANYLHTQGYKDIKILKSGFLPSVEQLPFQTRHPVELINLVLKYYSENEAEDITAPTTILKFGPWSKSEDYYINMTVSNTSKLNNLIDSLSKKNLYLIQCTSNHYCYQAVNFWYLARNKISIIGYTGYIPTSF